MAVKMRLARCGRKKYPVYHIVVADERAPRDGKFIEKLGTYTPILSKDNPNRVVMNVERVAYWLSVGAKKTETVERLTKSIATA